MKLINTNSKMSGIMRFKKVDSLNILSALQRFIDEVYVFNLRGNLNRSLFYILVVITAFFASCKKETITNKSTFISVVQSDLDYTTRSCFQLTDGSFIICGSNVSYPSGTVFYGQSNALMAKFSKTGDLIWQKKLPGILYNLWKGIPLPDGGFALAGLDSLASSTNVYIARFTSDGDLVKSSQVVNITTQSGSYSENQVDFIQLRNGNFAMVLIARDPVVLGSSPRIIIFDYDLNILQDENYLQKFSNYRSYHNMRICESYDGKIFVVGRVHALNSYVCTFIMRMNGTTLVLEEGNDRIGGDSTSVPGPFVLDDNGNVNITTAEQFNPVNTRNYSRTNYFYFNENECFSIGKSVSVLQTNGDCNFVNRFKYSGFANYACFTNIIRTIDGGFLMIGTSNLKTDAIGYSSFQILLVKTDAQFNQQWLKQINTTYAAVAVDIKQLEDGGYLIGAFEKSFNKTYKMILIKTDANGTI